MKNPLRWLLVKADWDAAYVNALPDSAFLFIDDDGNRHLPYKDSSGKVDEAHLDNALSRLGQDATGKNWPGFDREKVKAKAEKIKAGLAKAADAADMEAMTGAVLAAVYAAAAEYECNTDKGFTLSPVADQDGDADGDGNTLFVCCMSGYDFYVLASGGKAEVIASYCWADQYMACREDIAEELLKQDSAGTSLGERTDSIMAAVKAKKKKPAYETYKVIKADEDQQYSLGVAYPHNEVDAHGDFTDERELELAAWNFMRSVVAKGDSGVGLDHADGTDGAAEVVESYIYRGPDWVNDDGDVLAKSGDWLVGALWSDDAWESVKKDERTGWSIQGLAFRVEDEGDA